MTRPTDAVVVGAGPNGLAAAITIARAGRTVTVLEAAGEPGGGLRSAELTLPGFVHDVCSAIHPLAVASPFLQSLPLERHGLQWIEPEVALAHPLDGGRAGALYRSSARTIEELGADGAAFRRWIEPHVRNWDALAPTLLGPMTRVPRHPVALARFGLEALPPATFFGRRIFDTDEARGLFAGCAAHAFLALSSPMTSSFGVLLAASAGAVGWPMVRGGSGRLAAAMVAELESLGGVVECDRRITSLADLPPYRAVLFDLAPRQVSAIAGAALGDRYRRRLERFRAGPAVFKLDYALSGPIPWDADVCRRAGTVHVGGTADEIATSERDVASGRVPERPYLLVAQQSLADSTRAPAGQHTLWAYCHVPNGSTVDMTERIERQIHRFAPGFRDLVIGRHTAGPEWFEHHDGAYIGGDISGGSYGGLQIVFRPAIGRPYRTSNPTMFICSGSTPPGGGVHGMCGHHAANVALKTALR
jgi:phytoene dehydrogenase-like protein